MSVSAMKGYPADTAGRLPGRNIDAATPRTRILSPVDGYVTNLLAQLGDYVNVGANTISLVDANSFWVDGYFEETTLAPIRVGDPAQIKLMGHGQIVAPRTTTAPQGPRCLSENLCCDAAVALEEFHGVAVGILNENGANSEIKRIIDRGNVAPTRLIDGELIRTQTMRQKQAGDLLEPGDLQGEVPRRVDSFQVGAGRHQVNRKMVPGEKPVWLSFAGRKP
jgi:hypothetical protein